MVVTDFPDLQGEYLGGRNVVVVASPAPARVARVPALGRSSLIAAMAGTVLAAWFAKRRN
jgi:hypothetical protein